MNWSRCLPGRIQPHAARAESTSATVALEGNPVKPVARDRMDDEYVSTVETCYTC